MRGRHEFELRTPDGWLIAWVQDENEHVARAGVEFYSDLYPTSIISYCGFRPAPEMLSGDPGIPTCEHP